MWQDRREQWNAQADDARDAADIDYARIIHSASFRRLQGKTQILNLGDSDFYRTRLTHSLEVAQIAGGIIKHIAKKYPSVHVQEILPDRSLIHAIGCTHDLGHPPFGHGGETALNYCMRGAGGFEGNGQTLRILSSLENFSKNSGANLTRRSLLGVLKYPVAFSKAANPEIRPELMDKTTTIRIINAESSKPPKCYMDSEKDVVDWILEPVVESDKVEFERWEPVANKHNSPLHKSFDCSIMDVADDIAYAVHDLEDAVALNLYSRTRFEELVPENRCTSFLNELKKRYPDEVRNDVYSHFLNMLFGDSGLRKRCISRLVFHFVSAVEIEELQQFQEPVLRFRAKVREPERTFLKALKSSVYEEVIKSPGVQHLEFKGQEMVVAVFEAMQSDPKRLLPRDAYKRYESARGDLRVLCDYVAGMTDTYLLKTFERLFSPRMGSVFDKL